MIKNSERNAQFKYLKLTLDDIRLLFVGILDSIPINKEKEYLNSDPKISFKIENNTFEFNSFDEFEKSPDLPDTLDNLNIYYRGENKTIICHSHGLFKTSTLHLSIQGHDENWCVGTLAVLGSILKDKRDLFWILNTVWFSSILSLLSLVNILCLLAFVFTIIGNILPGNKIITDIFTITFPFLILTCFKESISPKFRITIRKKESWIDRHQGRIVVACSILAVFIALAQYIKE